MPTGCGNLDWRDLGGMGKLLAIEPHFEVKHGLGARSWTERTGEWVVDSLAEQIMGRSTGRGRGSLGSGTKQVPIFAVGRTSSPSGLKTDWKSVLRY